MIKLVPFFNSLITFPLPIKEKGLDAQFVTIQNNSSTPVLTGGLPVGKTEGTELGGGA